MKLYELSVRKPVLVSIGLVTLLVLGFISIYKLPLEFFPRMDFPFIGVYVPYPNSLPSHIEKKISKPIEEVMETLGDVRYIFSESGSDGGFIGVVFNWGRDVDVLRMEVKEKVDQIRNELPADIQRIQIFTFNTNDAPIMVGRISAKGRDLAGSYELLERAVINPLRRIEGVGQVQIDGIEPREIIVYLQLDKLKAHHVDVGSIFALLQNTNVSSSVGEITSKGYRYNIRALGNFGSIEAVENLAINQAGLRLKDVADIYYGQPEIGYGRHLNREKAIAFEVKKSSGTNTVEVARNVRDALKKINTNPALAGINVIFFWDQSEQIISSLNGLKQAGMIGSLFAIIVLYFFLRRLTTTLIVAVAIPFSVLCTCTFLYFSGRTLNLLTMMGLMLGVGMLVDNAIVVLESIFRHQGKGTESVQASIIGTREVATAVVAATLTSVIVFAPVIFTQDSTGLLTFLSQVGVTISVALIFSLIISLTLIPFLTSRFLKPKKVSESAFLEKVQERYLRILRWTALKRPYLTGFAILFLIVLLTVVGAKVFKFKFDMGEGNLVESLYVSYEFTDNLSYTETEKYVNRVEEFLFAHQDSLGIETVYSYYTDNGAATTIYFHDKYLSKKRLKEMRKTLHARLPLMAGAKLRLGDEEGEQGGGVTNIRVTLFGDDVDLLTEIAEEVKRRFQIMGKLEDVRTSIETGRDEIRISLNRDRASRYGINPETVGGIMNLTFRGMPLRKFQAKDHEIPMTIELSPQDKLALFNLENMLVGYSNDQEITLGAVADFTVQKGPSTIRREHQKTAVSVQGLYDGEDSKQILDEISGLMNTVQMPIGYSWSFSDRIREEQQKMTEMLINVLLALACVYMVMAALFESFLHPLVIMFCLPFAFIGVVWMMIITNTAMSIMSMIGLVILIGVVVNNGIILIDHINNFRRMGYALPDAIIEGGRERFRPIVMTAATTILGLTPMAVGSTNLAGLQYYPLARAVMGGLISATLLTLIMLPTYYVIADRAMLRVKRIWQLSRNPKPIAVPVPDTGRAELT